MRKILIIVGLLMSSVAWAGYPNILPSSGTTILTLSKDAEIALLPFETVDRIETEWKTPIQVLSEQLHGTYWEIDRATFGFLAIRSNSEKDHNQLVRLGGVISPLRMVPVFYQEDLGR